MTDAEKKMKKYCNALERRLNLPRDVKSRVMTDFRSSIQARQEAGMADDEIYADLGTPKQAAVTLNEQMKEYAYRKSPWRYLFGMTAVIAGGWLVLYFIMQRLGLMLNTLSVSFENDSASIGIIGGADGPTSIFVSTVTTAGSGLDWDVVLVGLILVGSILAYLRLRKCKQK